MPIHEAFRDEAATVARIIAEANRDLQRWYRKLGFVDGELKRFPHLPFSVKYMSHVNPSRPSSPEAHRQ